MSVRGRGAPVGAIVLAALALGCAKEEPPPGHGPDQVAPRVVALTPEYGASVPGFDGKASVRFDEPLSDPRTLTRQVTGSPAGLYRVQAGRRGLQIRPEGDWVEGAVYFIRLPAGATDLLRNRTEKPVEWLFRVGGAVPDTEVKGRLIDRVSGRGERDGRLLFLSADSVPYTAVSDTGGTYRLPGLPEGEYEAVGWMDQNRNFLYDPAFEPGAVVPFTMAAGGRVTGLDIVMLPADTTPPRVASAEAVDSVTIRVSFDDPLDPDADADSVPATVAVRDSVTGAAVAVDSFVVGIPAGRGLLPGDDGAAPDEAGDGAVEDELEPEPEAEVEPDPEAELLRGDEPGGDRLLPGAGPSPPGGETEVLPPAPTEVTILLQTPLAEGVYEVELTGFANLRGLRGGGVTRFGYAPPPPPDPAAPDSAVVVPDSAAAEPESP